MRRGDRNLEGEGVGTWEETVRNLEGEGIGTWEERG